ncbi:hypothetical protein EON65_13860 [archaeon]|nr:MAG: hypothetical protein EON65_13860 [archaeon]
MMRVVLAVACYAMVFMTKFSCGEVAKSMAEDVHNMEDVYNNHQMALLRAFNLPEGVTVVEEEAKPVSHIRTNQGPPLPLPPGWVYGYAFSGTGCTGTRDLATGLVTEKCLAPVDSTRPLSYRITCTPGTAPCIW